MEVRLILDPARGRRRTIRLQSEETVIGRRNDCDLRVPAAEVSRRHCLLSIHQDCLHVEDLNSVNGTFVNGRRVTGKQVLLPGDRLEVGPLGFRIEYELTSEARERLERQGVGVEAGEDLEVLPLAEEDVEPVVLAEDDQRAAFQFVNEEDTELVSGNPAEAEPPLVEAVDEDEPVAAEEFELEADWPPPGGGDARRGPFQSRPPRPR